MGKSVKQDTCDLGRHLWPWRRCHELLVVPTPMLLAAHAIASTSRSQAYLFCVLPHRFLRKSETARNLQAFFFHYNVCIHLSACKPCGHEAWAHPGFCSTKQLGICLLLSGYDASPLDGYSPTDSHTYMYTLVRLKGFVQEHNMIAAWQGLKPRLQDPESSAVTMRPSQCGFC